MKTFSSSTTSATIEYLKSLKSIRDRCEAIYELTLKEPENPLVQFHVHEDKLGSVVDFVEALIKRDYRDPLRDIPPHGRWRHFLPEKSIELAIIEPLKARFGNDCKAVATSVIDLFVVSVLLDAGAGDRWSYLSPRLPGERVGRSEGLAMASMDMFMSGLFSASGKDWQVDAAGLERLNLDMLSMGLQVDPETNPLLGLSGRLELLKNLGKVLGNPNLKRFFKSARPGNLIEFLEEQKNEEDSVAIEDLWQVVMEGFGGVWPASRTKIGNVSMGDVWPSELLSSKSPVYGDLVPFHKLSQWLTYSVMEPIEEILGWKIVGQEQMTGLAEYRNGGLFIDFGVIELKPQPKLPQTAECVPSFPPNHEVIIQWRALTLCLLDRLLPLLQNRLHLPNLNLPKMLEAGTWKAGREIAKKLRPKAAGPPISIVSDGTVF